MPPAATRRETTRARLLDAALRLFAERGYEETTTARVAAEAGVTEMTLFRHFPTKADLVLDDPYDPLLAAAVARQPRDLPPVVRLARGIREAWRGIPAAEAAEVRARLRIVASSPSLRGAMWHRTAGSERVLADQLVSDGTPVPVARVAASATLAALSTSLLVWAETDEAEPGHAVTRALDVLEHRP